jgi:flagellar hook-associated protein 1 FlgK
MPNFSAKIIGNSLSALVAQQALITNSSNNIANVNTPGYTRRDVTLTNRADSALPQAALSYGSGVEVGKIARQANAFLEASVRDAIGRQATADVRDRYLGRAESVFSLTGPQQTIGSTLNDFFASVSRLAVNPSSIDDRLVVLQKGQDLVSAIKSAYSLVAQTQTELDTRVPQEVQQVNEYTKQIAQLNSVIKSRQAAQFPAVDELDQRDVLLGKLSEKLTFQSLEMADGTVNISLENGFPLVSGATARPLEVTASPSFGGGELPPSLEGRTLSYIVYNFGTEESPSHIDLTKVIKNGQGALGGILQLRGYADVTNGSAFDADGDLVTIASRIEALTRSLLTDINEQYLGADEDSTVSGHQASSADLDGNPPDVFGLFDFDYSGLKDADSDGLPSVVDLASTGLDNFSSRLKLGFSTPQAFAASRDNDTTEGSTVFLTGDGQNAAAIANMKSSVLSFDTGSFSMEGTFDELYSSTVNYVGTIKSKAEEDVTIAKATLTSAQAKRDEFSSVSLDEEFTNLIKYQKAFQASARLVKTASDLLEQLVGLL